MLHYLQHLLVLMGCILCHKSHLSISKRITGAAVSQLSNEHFLFLENIGRKMLIIFSKTRRTIFRFDTSSEELKNIAHGQTDRVTSWASCRSQKVIGWNVMRRFIIYLDISSLQTMSQLLPMVQ